MGISKPQGTATAISCFVLFLLFVFLIKSMPGIFATLIILATTLLLFYGLRIFIRDSVVTVFTILVLTILISFFPAQYQYVLAILSLLIATVFIAINLTTCRSELFIDLKYLRNLPPTDILAWFLIISLLLFQGNYNDLGFLANDITHHPYSLSHGQSYRLSLFHAPDLSFSGKELRYQPLFELTPLLFSNILNTSLLSSIYFETLIYLIILTVIALHSFLNRLSVGPVPILVIYFFPLYYFSQTYFAFSVSASYMAAFLLALISIYLLNNSKYVLLLFSVLALFLIKAMFVITLVGGIGLYLLRIRNYRLLVSGSAILIPIASILYIIFLSGSGNESFWFVFPQLIYERIPSIFFSDKINFEYRRWITIWIPLIFLYSAVHVYAKSGTRNDLLLLASISLSGFLGILLLTDPVGLDARLFYRASSLPTILVFYYWLNALYFRTKTNYFLATIPALLLSSWAIVLFFEYFSISFRQEIVALLIASLLVYFYRSQAYPRINRLLALYSFYAIVAVSVISTISTNNVLHNSVERLLPFPTQQGNNGKSASKQFNYTHEFLDAYSWLGQHISKTSTVLFGNHYEVKTGSLIRSAISGRQFFVEGDKWKGVILEPDYAIRYANTIHFFRHFVEASEVSADIFRIIDSTDVHIGEATYFTDSLEIERYRSYKAQLLYYLSFGNNWSWINVPARVNRDVRRYWEEYEKMEAETLISWARKFLQTSHINYIVLEFGDQPSAMLQDIAETVFENESITILKVN